MEVLPESFVPDDISCSDQVFDISFHPVFPFIACGLINGRIEVHKYGTEDELVLDLRHHSSSCRGLQFSDDGLLLYSISSDKSIHACDPHGKSVHCFEQAHSEAINKIICFAPNHLATGDDAGCVKIWDTRQSQHVMEFDLHEDFISGMTFVAEYNTLLTTGGDATLCAYDLRKPDGAIRSDDQEAELHCVHCIKGGKKVVCGTQEGVIIVFSWGRWGDCSDRFPGHPTTVDCMLKVDESTLLTGSGDGLIRVVSVQPNKMLGIIGDHDQFPVEGLGRSADMRTLGSFSHDEVVRFWDVSMLVDDDDDDDDEDEKEDEHECQMEGDVNVDGMEESKGVDSEDDVNEVGKWQDEMDDDGSDMDSSDSSDDKETTQTQRPRFNLPSANDRFFSDL